MRARAVIETQKKGEKQQIVVTEIPYMTNKARLLEKIAELVNDKRIEGISDLRDESDREGIRVVIELKRGANAEIVLNKLYRNTPMQTTFGIIFLAIVDNQPEVMPLADRSSGTSSTTAKRSSSAARSSTCARPRSGRTSSKAWSRRSTSSTRSSSSSARSRRPAGGEGRAHLDAGSSSRSRPRPSSTCACSA